MEHHVWGWVVCARNRYLRTTIRDTTDCYQAVDGDEVPASNDIFSLSVSFESTSSTSMEAMICFVTKHVGINKLKTANVARGEVVTQKAGTTFLYGKKRYLIDQAGKLPSLSTCHCIETARARQEGNDTAVSSTTSAAGSLLSETLASKLSTR